ncbi:class A beta-lactamase [uncultured Fibrobacter sp.]|uniref:class A beta-lactamase n=1 Tax=uncultured Fibrobacter sp. TaxID=261512 RepID=UPI0035A58C40
MQYLHSPAQSAPPANFQTQSLVESIAKIASNYPGEIGVVAIINNTDTIAVNNKPIYPMMSVFKMHQALALCHAFDLSGRSLDSSVTIQRDKLDSNTWSPMMKEHPERAISLTVKDLLRYSLAQSDNNASNLMFQKFVNTAQTDSFIASVIPRSSFQIAYTEEEMSADHDKAFANYTSPLGAAMLINRLFNDTLISPEKQNFIATALQECLTGKDRIVAPLQDKEGVSIAHKTSSGYTNAKGVLAAHNDVAYIRLPNNVHYALAVFVTNFKGNETQAAQAIARISSEIYAHLAASLQKP